MRLWLSRGSGISVREQLVTQVVLGILSGDLNAAQRLPSTRELARFMFTPTQSAQDIVSLSATAGSNSAKAAVFT